MSKIYEGEFSLDKRYQVFVSSTYEDLQEERQEVMHALLELDCMPSGMELFPATNEDQWSLIKNVIDDCDYYIVISAGRYGSIGKDGLSYTEMEYRYALEKEKPIIAFLHKDLDSLTAKKTEKSAEGKKKLDEFRELLQQKMCKFWNSPAELGSVVSRSLVRLIKTNPAIGWVKADQLPNEDLTSEILRLRNRIEELENELKSVTTKPPEGTDILAQGSDEFTINYGFLIYKTYRSDGSYYTGSIVTTWDEIFSTISPSMINEASERTLRSALTSFTQRRVAKNLSNEKEIKNKNIDDFRISDSDFDTIKVQLKALGLIQHSNKQRSVKDKLTYWTLTPYGNNLMTKLRAIRR